MVETPSPSLTIFYENHEVADLSYDLEKGTFALLYTADWLKNGFPLSPHLPMFSEFPADNIKKFLENLLPEGEALRTLTRSLKIPNSNIYALVSAIGKDATGAFSFAQKSQKVETSFRSIPIEELSTRISERANKPISIWDGKPRLSLAGVQEKLAVTLKDGIYGLGEGSLASTHILKFSQRNQHLVINEYYCMKLAQKIGLSVAPVSLLDFGERVLQVERFDRHWLNPSHVERLHIIDGCQALNAPPEFKYQRIVPVGPERDLYLGPINASNLSDFNKECKVPAKAQLQLLHWILFNLAIGNTDSHGKNISYFVDQKGYTIAPSYDLVNVTVYEDFHHELAFKIGDTFNLDEVKAFQLADLAQQLSLSPKFMASQLKQMCTKVLSNISSVEIPEPNSEEALFMKKMYENISARTSKLLEQVPLIVAAAKSL